MAAIIISGGTQGLGEAIARRVAQLNTPERGDQLVITGRSVDRGTALADELTAAGTETIFVQADMTEADAPATIVDACLAKFGAPRGLVNVAAATTRATLFTDTPEHFDFQMQVNAKSPYFMIQRAAKAMIDGGIAGSIVNVGSVAGHGGQTKLTAYAMSKAALQVMTKSLAFGLMRQNIRVNQVNPGWMDTESEHRTQIEQDGAPENWLEIAEAERPMGRLVKPWEVANMVVFLLSEESGMTTGNWIDIDQSVQGAGDPPIPTPVDTVAP